MRGKKSEANSPPPRPDCTARQRKE